MKFSNFEDVLDQKRQLAKSTKKEPPTISRGGSSANSSSFSLFAWSFVDQIDPELWDPKMEDLI